jgi:hypothetical protein
MQSQHPKTFVDLNMKTNCQDDGVLWRKDNLNMGHMMQMVLNHLNLHKGPREEDQGLLSGQKL